MERFFRTRGGGGRQQEGGLYGKAADSAPKLGALACMVMLVVWLSRGAARRAPCGGGGQAV